MSKRGFIRYPFRLRWGGTLPRHLIKPSDDDNVPAQRVASVPSNESLEQNPTGDNETLRGIW